MKVYRIRHSVDKSIGSKFPQVKDATGDFNVNSRFYIGNPEFYLRKIDFTPQIPELLLWDSAVATDLISSSFMETGTVLLVSGKLQSILEPVLNTHTQSFQICVYHKSSKLNYWYLRPSKISNELIDFSSSEIWECLSLLKSKKISFNDSQEFEQVVKNTKYPISFHIENYQFKSLLPPFFIVNYIDGGIGYFVSEKLRGEIEDAGCTGIVFTEPNEKFP